mgnify:CR=1 FL=1|jgi:hypothetical protein
MGVAASAVEVVHVPHPQSAENPPAEAEPPGAAWTEQDPCIDGARTSAGGVPERSHTKVTVLTTEQILLSAVRQMQKMGELPHGCTTDCITRDADTQVSHY